MYISSKLLKIKGNGGDKCEPDWMCLFDGFSEDFPSRVLLVLW